MRPVKPALALLLLCGVLPAARAATWYVATNGSDAAAGTTWAAAKQTIQAAVDLAAAGDTVLVSNGVYAAGARVTPGYSSSNRVVITQNITVQSVNGPGLTSIQGRSGGTNDTSLAGNVRCVFMTDGVLSGFTLTNGASPNAGVTDRDRSGGGAFAQNGTLINCVISGNTSVSNGGGSFGGTLISCTLSGNSASFSGGGACNSSLSNCTLSGNSALRGGGSSDGTLNNCTLSGNAGKGGTSHGGGSYRDTLRNCVLTGNSAVYGGGADDSVLRNCRLSGNSAQYGGGTSYSTINNCTVFNNTASPAGGGSYHDTGHNCIVYYNFATYVNERNYSTSDLKYSCTLPQLNAAGCITGDPQFVNAAASNFHLKVTSPCIDTGDNAFASIPADLDGNPRIVNGVVDMGAYEGARSVVATVANPTNGGSVSGGGFLLVGSNAVLTATPSPYWVFTVWNDGNTEAARTITVPATNITYTATFTRPLATIFVQTNPANGGAVTGGGTFQAGSNVLLRATPNAYWLFTAWNDGETSATRTITVPVTNITFTASFTQQLATVSVQTNPAGGGTVVGGGLFQVGSTQQVAATANFGWAFGQWEDGSTQNPRSVIVPLAGTNVTAIFTQLTAVVTAEASPTDGGSVVGDGIYFVGSTQQVSAAANFGWRFAGWLDGVMDNPRTVAVPTAGTNLTAVFTQVFATVTVEADPGAGGAVLGGGLFPAGTDIVISASASNGWSFTGWNDGETSAVRTVSVPETNILFRAGFTQLFSSVTVAADPVNGGDVAGGGSFAVGSNIVISATPGTFWSFAGWNDGETSPVRTVAVPASNITFTASFSQRQAFLSMAANPTQGGTVGGGGTHPAGSSVGLSATANRGWRFLSWNDGDTQAVRSVFMPLTGATYVASFRVRTAMDFDPDNRGDIAVFHPAGAAWYVRKSATAAPPAVVLGTTSSVAVAGDYDGDGVEDLAAYDAPTGNWIIRRSSTGAVATNNWGWSAAFAVPADYDGDGIADLAVFHAATGNWYIRQSSTGSMLGGAPITFGWSAAMPVPADYDGDGKADLAVYHPAAGNWYVRLSSTSALMSGGPVNFGWSAAMPVPADYDGDGKADLAVYHPAAGNWYVRLSSTSALMTGGPIGFGWSAAAPAPADYDGDGQVDLAVYHPGAGNWYIRKSTDGNLLGGGPINWGWSAAVPVMPQFQTNRRFFPSP